MKCTQHNKSRNEKLAKKKGNLTIAKNIKRKEFIIPLTVTGPNSYSSKILNLCPNNIDPSVITSIQLQHP